MRKNIILQYSYKTGTKDFYDLSKALQVKLVGYIRIWVKPKIKFLQKRLKQVGFNYVLVIFECGLQAQTYNIFINFTVNKFIINIVTHS